MKSKASIYAIALVGVVTAVTCVMGPNSIPIGPVPISLTNLAICMGAIMLGWKLSTVSTLVYLLIGAVGVPVFSNYSGGFAKLVGPTGGYLIGFIFLALITGIFADKFNGKVIACVIGMVMGTIVLYLFGTAWLAYQMKLSFGAALGAGVIPFILGDIIKIVLAGIIAPVVRKEIKKAGLN